jgi:catechol 2,3-dioxygenase-like lactoylglutathione lyase family enzyme
MPQSLALITYLVRDYDEAITWFTHSLGWTLFDDTKQPDGKRWVVVTPRDHKDGASLLLARAASSQQAARVGDQTGGRVALFLETDDFDRDHRAMLKRGVRFLEAPREELYGKVAVFEDLYGNRWDLLQRN